MLEAKHARITIIQQDGQRLPEIPAERIAIKVLQGGLLSSIEIARYKTTLQEARELMLPYLTKSGRKLEELERFLTAVKNDYLDYDGFGKGVGNFEIRWNDESGLRYIATFRKAFDPNRPLIFYISLDWAQVRSLRQQRSLYKEPIPPPPGYENESMEAPETFGPDSEANILKSQGKTDCR